MNDPTPDYKSTLNLPQTDFPMQANLARREPEMLARWESERLYDRIDRATADRPPYWFVDGPPYANGDIHLGHAVNKVLKDLIVKAARLDGRHARFVPGWDCHGLPIELQIEKKFGKVGQKLDAGEFRRKCREYALQQVDRQREDFKRLGVLADWERPYLTLQPAYEAEQLRVLSRIVDKGYVVHGYKPVHWCLDCASSLAEAEVEYQDKASTALDVAFPVADPAELALRFGATETVAPAFLIWTTTYWSIPGNQAIAVNPELDYVLVRFADHGDFVVAEGLLEACSRRYGIADIEILGRTKGQALAGLMAARSLDGGLSPILLGDHVTLEAGTGLVHTAPAHGVDDFLVCRANGIETHNPIGMDGRYKPGTPAVTGLHVRAAEEPLLAALREAGALVHANLIHHSYPHCWRHKTPLITMATSQWFIAMDAEGNAAAPPLRQVTLDAIGTVNWIPGWGEQRIQTMVAGRPDWCISRQRSWGVPLAIFAHKQTQALHPRSAELLLEVAGRVAVDGIDAWFDSSGEDWLGAEAADYDQCRDTLDVWFDSGSAHQCVFAATQPQALDAAGLAPTADLYLEGSDQHRGWFQSSLLTAVAMRGQAPYRNVLTHGFTVDEQGRKMSKSLGNVISPQQIVKTLGADVLRLWVAASDYSGEIALSDDLLKRIADAYRRIRNTVRYLLGNLDGFDPASDCVAPVDMVALDRWAVQRAIELQDSIAAAYRDSQFHSVYQELHNYCVVELGGLYLDVLKDRLYTLPANSQPRRSAQTAMFHIAQALVRWITPILSFTADEIFPSLPGANGESVFAQTWYRFPAMATLSAGVANEQAVVREGLDLLRGAVKKQLETCRANGEIGSPLDAVITLYVDTHWMSRLEPMRDELRFWFIVSDCQLAPADSAPEAALPVSGGGLWISVAASSAEKCLRCWHHRPDVGTVTTHPLLCARCAGNLDGQPERRLFF